MALRSRGGSRVPGPVAASRRSFLRGLAVAAVAVSVPVPALAAPVVCHVDSELGDDANRGVEAASPVRTLARARALCAGASGGSVVRLRADRRWHEQLEAWPYLQIGVYGQGARPVIDGSDALPGSWTLAGAGTWSMPVADEPANLWMRGSWLVRTDDAVPADASWSFAGGTLRLRTGDGASPADVRRQSRTWGVFSYSGADGVGIEGIEFVHATKGVESYDNHGWKVRGCRLSECGENGIRIVSGGKALRGVEVVGNEVGAIRWKPVIDYFRAGISVCGAVEPLVDLNVVRTVNTYGITVDEQNVGGMGGVPNQAPRVTRNLVEDCQGGIYVFQGVNPDVSRNVVRHGRGLGIGFGGPRSFRPYAGYNLIHDIEIAPDRSLYNGFDINNCPGGLLEHNTVAGVANYCVTLEDDDVPSDDWTVRDNVFDARLNKAHPAQPAGNTGCLSIHDAVTRWKLLNNCYATRDDAAPAVFERGDAPSPFMDYARMLALTLETGSIRPVDPMFVDPGAGDYRLRPGSPCVGAASDGSDMGAFAAGGLGGVPASPGVPGPGASRIYFRASP